MTPERWAEVRRLFDEALERPEKHRAAFLHFASKGDEELRREVEALLASHRESGDFLETPVAQVSQALLATEQRAIPVPAPQPGGTPTRSHSWSDDWHGRTVGLYKLERRIGSGGMGSVWYATRADAEFNKQVAVKVLRGGMDSEDILRRFRLERQLLASLEHPNIAHLIDGGSTAEGVPYLIMEYVEGTPIDEYCETYKLPISERLKLFRALCSAVQYAHQNLIVHRDIKTSNVMVTRGGVPKLLDFGIAKVLQTDGGGNTTANLAQTRPGMRPMTIDYASPEQVRGEPITTSTDIYSLGVLLYRVLTGKLPYGGDVRQPSTLLEAIRSKDPVPPSHVVLTEHDDAIPQATQKMATPEESRDKARRRLRKKLAGDLDAVILYALRKKPQDRYVSAEQFSEDIRRFLEGLPVMARSGSFGYRAGKFVRRNVWSVAASLLLGAGLIAAASTGWKAALGARGTLAATEIQYQETRRQLMHNQLELGKARETDGDTAGAYAALSNALDIAEDLAQREMAASRTSSPETQLVLAEGNASMGRVLVETGAGADASRRLKKAQELYSQLAKAQPANTALAAALRAVEESLRKAQGPL